MVELSEFFKKSGCEENLSRLLGDAIPNAIKRISIAITKQSGELAGSQNVYGEKQLALDVQANEIIINELKKSGLVGFLASEELEEIMKLSAGVFTIVFDPLDGSSLVDVNLAVGSIFGIYPGGNPIGRKGEEQLAAAIAIYGPRTTMLVCPGKGKGVHEFLMKSDGLFYLTKENLKVSDDAKYFAPGNLRACKERKDYLKLLDFWSENGYTLRYSGGMVPDLNHIFLKGNGIFSYPPYSEAPAGKLRLLFECAPMAFLMEEAGGAATDGKMRLLEKTIDNLHKRTPIFIGSKNEVKRCENL